MGMTSDQNENVSFAEQQEIAKREAELAKEQKAKPSYIMLCPMMKNGEQYEVLVGEDKRYYKMKLKRWYRIDEHNRSPLIPEYDGIITPFDDSDRIAFFGSK